MLGVESSGGVGCGYGMVEPEADGSASGFGPGLCCMMPFEGSVGTASVVPVAGHLHLTS